MTRSPARFVSRDRPPSAKTNAENAPGAQGLAKGPTLVTVGMKSPEAALAVTRPFGPLVGSLRQVEYQVDDGPLAPGPT
jgi:hypothetical protein